MQGVQCLQDSFSGQIFLIFEIDLFCFVVAISDLVHNVEVVHGIYYDGTFEIRGS